MVMPNELWLELKSYGIVLADFNLDSSSGSYRIRVIKHDMTKVLYWVVQHNGNVIELKELETTLLNSCKF